jgi:hypothetical protein
MVMAAGLIALSMLVFPGSSCTMQSTPDQPGKTIQEPHSMEALQADFEQFRAFIEGSHPQLYRFTPRPLFDSLFEEQYHRIDRPMTTQEFYRILIPLVVSVGCGHTSLWSPDRYWDCAPDRMFPLGVYARDEQLYVIHDYGQEIQVKPGSRIVSINGQPAGDLVREMLKNIWSDGFIETKRYQRLNDVFPYLFALLYGYPSEYLMVFDVNGQRERKKIPSMGRTHIASYRDSVYAHRTNLKMEQLDAQTALLTIRTFGYYNNVKGFHRFIDSAFQVATDRHIQNLVIDMRGNDGGDPFCSTHLLRYLQKEPVVYFSEPYGKYARFNQPLPMIENHFTGRQFYLIDGVCMSTTGHLTSLLRYHDLGVFIGEETGATFTCNDASHDIVLKNTGYRVHCPRGTFAAAVEGFPIDRGILPDHPVSPSVEDIIHNRDVVLEYTMELIGSAGK